MASERPHILRTPAVVLRSIDYGETSRIVTLYTGERGRMAVMVRGARSAKSRFGATLEPMSHMEAVIFCKPGRDLQNLTETSQASAWRGIRRSLDKLETGWRILEFTSALMHEEEAHEAVYKLLVSTLSALDVAHARSRNLWPFFQLQLVAELGFEPMFTRENVASVTGERGVLYLESGQIAEDVPGSGPDGPGGGPVGGPGGGPVGAVREASRAALRAFAILCRADARSVLNMHMDAALQHEVEALVTGYVSWHVETALPNRAEKVFAQIG